MGTGPPPPAAPPVHDADIVLIPDDTEDEAAPGDTAAATAAAAAATWPPCPSSAPPPEVSADEAASLALVRQLVAEELAAASSAVTPVDAAIATEVGGQTTGTAAAAAAATGTLAVAPWPDMAETLLPPHNPQDGGAAGAAAAVTPWRATAAVTSTTAATAAVPSAPSAPPPHPSSPLLGNVAGGAAAGSGGAARTSAAPRATEAATTGAGAPMPTPAVVWRPRSPGWVDTSSDAALAALLAEAPPTPPPPRRSGKDQEEAEGAAAACWANGSAPHMSPGSGASSGGSGGPRSSGGGLSAGVFRPPLAGAHPLPELPPHPPRPATAAARTAELAALFAQRASYHLMPPHIPPFPPAPLPIPQLPPAWAAAADAPLTLTPRAVSTVLAIVRAADASTSGRSAGIPGSLHTATEADAWPSAAWSAGWDCGYRNAQTLLSAALRWPAAATALAAAGILRVPSVRELQLRLEAAWSAGYDAAGVASAAGGGGGGGIALGGDAWVGAVDVVALLRSLRLRAGVADFDSGRPPPRRGGGSGGPSLSRLLGHRAGDVDAEVGSAAGKATATEMGEWAHAFFARRCREEGGCAGCGRGGVGRGAFISPLYMQHQGHSRTVVGADRRRDGTVRLLVVDPSKPLPGGGGAAEGGVGGGWTSSGRSRGRGRGRSHGRSPAGVGTGVAAAAALSAAEARAVVGRVRLAAGERGLASPRYQLVWVEGAARLGGCVLEAAELPRAKLIADSRLGSRG